MARERGQASLSMGRIIQCAPLMAARLVVLIFFLGSLLGGFAEASTPDVFGLGSESTALAGAVTARATDFSAAYYNPAGLALGGDLRTAAFGFAGYASRLKIGGQTR